MLRLMYGIGFTSMSSADTEFHLLAGVIREQNIRVTLVVTVEIGASKLEEPAQGTHKPMDKLNAL